MWIVYDPEPEAEVIRFDDDQEAVEWVAAQLREAEDYGHAPRVAMLKRCVVIPHDPERDD